MRSSGRTFKTPRRTNSSNAALPSMPKPSSAWGGGAQAPDECSTVGEQHHVAEQLQALDDWVLFGELLGSVKGGLL